VRRGLEARVLKENGTLELLQRPARLQAEFIVQQLPGRFLAQRLAADGELVLDVPAKLAARVRVYSRGHGRKTDRDDVVSAAWPALDGTGVTLVAGDDATVSLRLLCDRRGTIGTCGSPTTPPSARPASTSPATRSRPAAPPPRPAPRPASKGFVALDWKDGRLAGIEILDASSRLHPDLLDEAAING
jgi:hypothetical protein